MKGLRLLVAGLLLAALPATGRAAIGSELNGLGSFGISLGTMRWWADGDARSFQGQGAVPRLMGKAVFRYRVSTDWLVAMESGFGWNGYPESNDVTTWVIPSTLGLERRLRDVAGATTSLCFGAGAYVWGRWEQGSTMNDPVSHRALRALDPGLYGGLAGETHLSQHVTCAAHFTVHGILATHPSRFRGELEGTKLFTELRLGVNYYFSPYEGLIWK
jgi:hypothetical protein